MASRRRAVLLTAQAQAAEDTAADKALELAREAHRLAPDLVPAAAIAGRVLAAQGNTPRAARVLLKTWRLSPHPDLAAAYAYARPGDSPRDRLNRMRHLARLTPHDAEGPIALAITAIEAREWDEARAALEPLLEGRLTQRVATLMARIEGEQHGHTGRVREWLARAVNAPRDPAWTADGVVSDRWAPVSPVTGALDAFRWRVPVEAIDAPAGALLSAKVEALVGLGAGGEPALAHAGSAKPVAAFPPTETAVTIDRPAAASLDAARAITVPSRACGRDGGACRRGGAASTQAGRAVARRGQRRLGRRSRDARGSAAAGRGARGGRPEGAHQAGRAESHCRVQRSGDPPPPSPQRRRPLPSRRTQAPAAAPPAQDRRAQDLRAPARARRSGPRAHRRGRRRDRPAAAGIGSGGQGPARGRHPCAW